MAMKTVEHEIEMHRFLMTFHIWGSTSKGNFKREQLLECMFSVFRRQIHRTGS